jgi:hypothetical protein
MTTYLLSVNLTDGENPYASDEEMQQSFADTTAVTERMQAQGVWLFAGGLEAADTATVVDATKGSEAIITDGPFIEAKEHIGGFWVINADDLDAALRWAAECSAACRSPIEVRPFDGYSQA